MYQLGFGCREEKDVRRVGPFLPGEKVTKEASEQMDRYMLRAWVEISIYLACFETRNGQLSYQGRLLMLDLPTVAERFVTALKIEDILGPKLNLQTYPTRKSPSVFKEITYSSAQFHPRRTSRRLVPTRCDQI